METTQRSKMVKTCIFFTICLTLFSTTYADYGDHDITGSYFDRNRLTQQQQENAIGCKTQPMGVFAPAQKNMVACNGNWTGHIKTAQLCADNWHVCNAGDKSIFNSVSMDNLLSVTGCYAMNAANKATVGCISDCQDGEDTMMVGAGSDCYSYDRSDTKTCFSEARIDLPKWKEDDPECSSHPLINGVICCRNAPLENKPQMLDIGYHKKLVKKGEPLQLTCRAEGFNTAPGIVWSKNGVEVPQSEATIIKAVNGSVTVSILSIASASSSDEGQYSCIARSVHGMARGVHHRVTVWDMETEENGCKAGVPHTPLPGGLAFACKGSWTGHVKNASNTLCASGYSVCNPGSHGKDVFNRVDIHDSQILPGCYALNAGSRENRRCAACNQEKSYNRMQGLGEGCGSYDPNMSSCLGVSRVDVWPNYGLPHTKEISSYSAAISGASWNEQGSCDYNAELTTGVLCCKKTRKQ